MDQHLTEKQDFTIKTVCGTQPATSNGEKETPDNPDENPGRETPPKPEEKPEKPVPETEKPGIHEMPKTSNDPEVENTDIDEVPETEITDIPDTNIPEMPNTGIAEMPAQNL